MNDNYKFYEKDNSSYIGSRIEGNPTNHPGEVDANSWADSFQSGDCGC